MKGWKEIEYEVVRDAYDNCIAVCNMENFDPLGVHTGDSIVVCPSQTLSNAEYMKLRSVAIKVARHLGIIGECNIQYALDPDSEDYCIIEVNARLSRSSALASKATGYPLAYVAAKLALGEPLPAVQNSITRKTTACFEPALDYCVVKFPRWDLNKFHLVSAQLGSSMKSVGEVMGIGRNFQEALQKAIRMAVPGADGFEPVDPLSSGVSEFDTDEKIFQGLSIPTDRRIFAIAEAYEAGYNVQRCFALSGINPWFLARLYSLHIFRKTMQKCSVGNISRETLIRAKQDGFSDKQLAKAFGDATLEMEVRARRHADKIRPFAKQIDTLAAEFPAQTNYLYMTYGASESDERVGFMTSNASSAESYHSTVILGCGSYRIGSSVEFDWCAVSCIRTLRKLGHRSIMINCNPETVSTDYDECDILYFEEISVERILDIYEMERADGLILSVGGQVPNNLALPLQVASVNILGTAPHSIDQAEDRKKFSHILDAIGVDQPEWTAATSPEEALAFCGRVSYPCLIRPSYVLSGAAMRVVFNNEELTKFLILASHISPHHPVVISKFVEGAKEIEIDAVARDGIMMNYAISEHVEYAGVHSGDATLMLPAQTLYVETVRRATRIARVIAQELNICGPFNLQLLAKGDEVKVIEVNVRASRSFPFVSKTLKVDFIEIATKIMVNAPVKPAQISLLDLDYVAVKVPVFSFTRLLGADPVLGVEMASTGEVAAFGTDKFEAILTSMCAAKFKIPKRNVFVCIGSLTSKVEFLTSVKEMIECGLTIFCSPCTYDFFSSRQIPVKLLHKPSTKVEPNITTYLAQGKIELVINVQDSTIASESRSDGYIIRRTAVDFSIDLLTDLKLASLIVTAIYRRHRASRRVPIQAWDEFV